MTQALRQCDPHNRDRDAEATNALIKSTAKAQADAEAWGRMAMNSIARGDFTTAINQLNAGLAATSHSQYTGKRFDV